MYCIYRATRAASIALVLVAFMSCGQTQKLGLPPIKDSAALKNWAGKRILIVVSAHGKMGKTGKKTGYWLGEVVHFYHVLARHGFKIDFVSPGGAPAIMDPGSLDKGDPLNAGFLSNRTLMQRLNQPIAPAKVNPKDYAAIYYAGGHGSMWDFTNARALASIAAQIYAQGGIVSAVCRGPSGLLNIKLPNGDFLVKGKRVTGFANFEESLVGKTDVVPYLLEDELKKRGGSYSKAFFPFVAHVVTDRRLITGQNPGSATGVGEAVARVLAQKKP